MKTSVEILFQARRLRLPAIIALIWLGAAAGQGLAADPAASGHLAFLAKAPLSFEANTDAEGAARFVARGRECDILLAPDEAVLLLGQHSSSTQSPLLRSSAVPDPDQSVRTRSVRLILQGANPNAGMTGLESLAGRANYSIGNDPAAWRTGVPLFSKVQVDDVYPGIQLIYYADESARLEYDFLLQPGARPERIGLRIEGADHVRVDAAGDLVLEIGAEEIRQHRPVIYQSVRGVRKQIAGGYRLTGRDAVGFWTGDYDRSLPLVIDPTLDFLTYLGGSKSENGWAIALDGAGNIYIAGETLSKGLPGTNGVFQTKYLGGHNVFGDAFIAKYGAASNELVYLTYLGGKSDDGALGLAVDTAGNAYVTGFTDSDAFPIVPTNGAIRSVITGSRNNAFKIPPVDAFVAKLNPSGSTLLFSTFLGGTRRDSGTAIAVEDSGAEPGVYVTGFADSTNFFPITAGAFQTLPGGVEDVFVTKLSLDGTNVIYSTYLGGTNQDSAEGIDFDDAHYAYVTGFTLSTNFPLRNPIVFTNGVFTNGFTLDHVNSGTNVVPFYDAFVTVLTNNGSSLIYSSYLGGSNHDVGLDIAVDRPSGNAYVTGYTFSRNFPTNVVTLPTSNASNFNSHVFVSEIAAGGGALVYSTQFGGTEQDQGTGIALDPGTGDAYVTGFGSSTNIFATNSITDFRAAITNASGKKIKQTSPTSAFVTVVKAGGASFTNSTYLGGSGDDEARGIALDTSNPTNVIAFIVGQTTSPNLLITNLVQTNLVQIKLGNTKNNKAADAFVGKIELPQ